MLEKVSVTIKNTFFWKNLDFFFIVILISIAEAVVRWCYPK